LGVKKGEGDSPYGEKEAKMKCHKKQGFDKGEAQWEEERKVGGTCYGADDKPVL